MLSPWRAPLFLLRWFGQHPWWQRWGRVVFISAVVQGLVLIALWFYVGAQRQRAAPILLTSTTIENAPTTDEPPSAETKSSQPIKEQTPRSTSDKGVQVLSSPKSLSTQSAQDHHQKSDKVHSIETTQSTTHPTQPIDQSGQLTQVPIAVQTIDYEASITNGKQTLNLPPAQWKVQALGGQRYLASLHSVAPQGQGVFRMTHTFVADDKGILPLAVEGGAYLKTPEHPKGFALGSLGLILHEDGSTWAWGKQSNSSARSHTYFLDRVALMAYIQGGLNAQRFHAPARLQLPIATRGSVQLEEVTLKQDHAEGVACQPCARAHIHADLGEMQDLSVWYDGQRNWQPVAIRMQMGHSGEWVLTLRAK